MASASSVPVRERAIVTGYLLAGDDLREGLPRPKSWVSTSHCGTSTMPNQARTLLAEVDRRERRRQHRMTCSFLTISADYIKFCGGRRELEEYARRDLGGAVQPCGVCL